MTKYKVTGREPDKETLIQEEIRNPDDPIPSIREIIGRRQQPKGGKESKGSPHRKFFLERATGKEKGYRYAEAGMVVYFPTKKAAKRVRNKLNKLHGSGTYLIQPLELKVHDIRAREEAINDVQAELDRAPWHPFGFIPFNDDGYKGD